MDFKKIFSFPVLFILLALGFIAVNKLYNSNEEDLPVVVGVYKSKANNYPVTITLFKDSLQYSTLIKFNKNVQPDKQEVLTLDGNKFIVEGSKVGEYYLINNDNNLELWDDKGYFITCYNIKNKPVEEKKIKLSSFKYQPISLIQQNYCNGNLITQSGTNNKVWIVLCPSLNVIFEVDKSSMTINKAYKKK